MILQDVQGIKKAEKEIDDMPSSTSENYQIKPRIRFCWHCSRKLRGNHFVEKYIHGHLRILHKSCEKLPEYIIENSIIKEEIKRMKNETEGS